MKTVRGLLRRKVLGFGTKSQRNTCVIQADDGVEYEIKSERNIFAEPENSPLKQWLGKRVELTGELVSERILIVRTIEEHL